MALPIDEDQTRFRVLFETSPDAVMLLDHGGFLDCNPAALATFGIADREAFVVLHPADLSPPLQPNGGTSRDEATERIDRALALGSDKFEWVHRRQNGEEFICDVWLTAFEVGDRRVLHSIVRDISNQKRLEAALQDSEQRLASIIHLFPSPTMVVDRDGRITAWNRAMEHLTKVSAEDMLGKGDFEYAIPFYGRRRPILIDMALRPDQDLNQEYSGFERRGEIIVGESFTPGLSQGNAYVFATATALRDSLGEIVGAVESIHDLTERKQAEDTLRDAHAKLREQASHDALTGLWNREAILQALARETERARRQREPIGLLMLDVDHFKKVNDVHGHLVGDEVLAAVAARMVAVGRGYDIVGRYGGEEFVIVAPGCDGPSTVRVAERIRKAFEDQPIQTFRAVVSVTVSLGVVAMAGDQTAELSTLLSVADHALYEAKKRGRNTTVLGHLPASGSKQ